MDLDAWINEPPSESEDETPVMNIRHENNILFSGETHSTDYPKAKVYVEPSSEELVKQRESRKQSEQMNPFYLKDTKKNKVDEKIKEISTPLMNGNESVQLKETISSHLPSSLSDQFYRQSKIDEENRRLKKKSKTDRKSSKKSHLPTMDDNDDDLYPTIKVTRGGELPEGITENANDDNEEDSIGKKKKNKKPDPHRALNIDLNEKPVVIQPPPPPEEPKPPSPPVEKPKKLKKKKTKEEEKVPIPSPPVIEEKPKKKKKTKLPASTDTNTSAPLLLDIMSDEIPSDQHSPEQDTFQLAAQSDHLIIVG